jgi:hypothetical protein
MLTRVGIPHDVPLHINKNGWGTAADRTPQRQASTLETIVRTVDGVAESLNITHYEHFALRGANSSVDDPFFQLGLLRDNYSPKPAFAAYRQLIAELGRAELM